MSDRQPGRLGHTAGLAELSRVVSERAGQHPDQVAVRCGEQTLGVAQLADRAAAIGEQLTALGLPAGSPVGVRLDVGTDLPAAVVAVGLAGLVLAPRPVSDGSVEGCRAIVQAGANGVEVSACGSATTQHDASADTDVVVLRTGGTTNGPRPVTVPFGRFVSGLSALGGLLGLGEGARLVSVAPPGSSWSAAEILLALGSGAELVLVPPQDVLAPAGVGALIDRLAPAVVATTPTYWMRLLSAGWPTAGTSHDRPVAVTTGEPLPPRLAARLLPVVTQLWNVYGRSDTGVCMTAHRVTEDDLGHPAGVPIGGALGDARPRLRGTDDSGELTGDATGELWVTDAAGDVRTGDLVTRSGGMLFHRGRVAESIVDGTPGTVRHEIETRLSNLDGVAACAVVSVPTAETVRMFAYLEVDSADTVDPDELRDRARQELLATPVTCHVIVRDGLPMTTDGRLDRRALRGSSTGAGDGHRPLSHETRVIARLWEELLGLPDPPVDVSFFELGGHSLVMIKLAARLEQAFGLPVPIADLFDNVTIAEQASLVERRYEEELAGLTSDG